MKLDPHRNEPAVELDKSTWLEYIEAKSNADAWEAEAKRRRAALVLAIGDSYAGLVDGKKVVTHRPKESWAVARILKDHPDLAQHFLVPRVVEELDIERFRKVYPEIAAEYQTRSFNTIGTIEG
jgi:hypothetical protein